MSKTADTTEIDSLIHGRVDPYIYAFETNTIPNFLKIGDTYRPVEIRLDEWRKIYADLHKKYEHIAKVDEKTYFRDYAVHDFLIHNGFRRITKNDVSRNKYFSNEFFLGAKAKNVEQAIQDIQKSFDKNENRYSFYDAEEHLPLGDFDFPRDADWEPRENQQEVIEKFSAAVKKGRSNLLMFAVMRFGKTFTSLCCAQAMKAKLVVVVCGKTAVRSEWKETVQRPKRFKDFCFVDSNSMKTNHSVVSKKLAQGLTVVVFLTMQDLLGDNIKNNHKDFFSLNKKKKLDLLIIDETHFGARAEEFGKVLGATNGKSDRKITKQEKTNGYDESFDELENEIKLFLPKVKLHLSGTPYRILLDNEFEDSDIVGAVQYSDIIDEKEKWDRENIEKDEWENPYYGFPQMIRFAFDLNESAAAKLAELKNNGYAYDLNELFSPKATSKSGENYNQFKHKNEVLDLLRAIDGSKNDRNVFSFLDYDKIKKGCMCRHIVMVLPYCASCDAMEKLLKTENFNNLNDYEIINIAGFDADNALRKSDYASYVKSKIEAAELQGKKTLSLTVGKMLTGCTVKEWDTMIFLRNTSSPQDYDQAIFRLQSQYVQTIKNNANGKIIKRDMKPQTLLVDFDPVRMYTLQHKKALIANINNAERGNDVLTDKLKRELEIAPIICMNHSKLQKVVANDIVDSIRKYNASKSMMDETFDIEVDQRIFEDETIKAIISKQPEITAKGIHFESSPHSSEDGQKTEIDDVDMPENPSAMQEKENSENESKKSQQNENNENKKLASKLQGYYFKLLLFAFLSEREEKNVNDVINHIENDVDGKRIGKNLFIDVSELKLVREKINPAILSCLENKIQNINQLGKEIVPEKIGVALRKMSRLSDSEVVTPDIVAKKLVDNLPDDISADSKILDIASKTGEFANVLLQKYGKKIKNSVYSIPTSSVTYECTRKIYRLLGMPVEHIYSDFTSYDVIDKTKGEHLIKELEDMKFDTVVGNPPYQETMVGTSDNPIYNYFYDAAFKLSDIVSLITPARYLYNAGKTPKEWNEKMLNDEHLKVVLYEQDSSKIFPNTSIKGGLAITLRDANKNFGKIGFFTNFPEVQSILKKVKTENFETIADLVYAPESYRLSKKLHEEHPKIKEKLSAGHDFDVTSNIFGKLDDLFTNEKPRDGFDYIKIFGLDGTKRTSKYIRKDYVDPHENLMKYKVFVPKSNGTGAIGEVLSTPVIGHPVIGHTQTFISIGKFDTKEEAEACYKYIKTKFARVMLGTLKITQDNKKATWANVPLQDFTPNSDINWNKPIADIDRQLYKKYNLSEEEIAFIESKVKAME
ncbi:MAG: DEAD/DEAH box helicase family protein [Treponema sp.]|nr:DEAD/DEAH box helicase family protein [Treponema sp.]